MYHFNNHVSECLYLCTDNLGSVIGIIDEHGEMCYDAKYDVWGNLRIHDTWEITLSKNEYNECFEIIFYKYNVVFLFFQRILQWCKPFLCTKRNIYMNIICLRRMK